METPPQGVPRAVTSEPDTGRLSRALHGELVAANPGGMNPSGEDVLDLLAAKLGSRIGDRTQPVQVPTATFLGLDAGAWTKMLIAAVGAALVAVTTWYLTLRDELRIRPTVPQIEEVMHESFEQHNDSSGAHQPIQERLESVNVEQQKIRESQVRQEENGKAQTDVLKDIKNDLRRLRKDSQ